MHDKVFINLPVKNLPASMQFYRALGYEFNPAFTDETAACMIVSDHIYVMLLTHEKFAGFTPRPIADATRSTEVLIGLDCESRTAVDALVHKAVDAGGSTVRPPEDHGFMYQHGYQDLDGHIWELIHLTEAAAAG